MNDHIIDRVIYGLVALSAVLIVISALGFFIQLHAKGSELLSWNSWLEYISSWSG